MHSLHVKHCLCVHHGIGSFLTLQIQSHLSWSGLPEAVDVLQALPAQYVSQRKEWVNIIMRSCVAFHFKEEVMHDGILLMDRAMASKHAPSVPMLPLTAAACLLISAQQGEFPDDCTS